MSFRKRIPAALAVSICLAAHAAAVVPGEIVTHLFPHKDGEARLNTGGNANAWIEVGRNGTVGWLTYVTGGVDLAQTTGASLTLYLDKIYTPGTLKAFALTQPINVPEMNVEGGDLVYNSGAPVATASVALADGEKVLRMNLGNILNQGPFYGLVLEASNGLKLDISSKESAVQPLIELRYAFATAAQVQQAIDAGLAAQQAAAAAQLSANTANTAADAATVAANAAQGYKVLAGQSADAAAGSASQAAGSAAQAESSATAAGASAASAGASATAAAGSATQSANSATAAGVSAAAAAGSAVDAGGFASAAGASAGQATSAAGAAAGSADAAASSADDAGGFASAAGSSAGAAAGSAASAAASADNATAAAAAAAASAAAAAANSGTGLPTGTVLLTNSAVPPSGFASTGIRVAYETPSQAGVASSQARYDVAGAVLNGLLYSTGGYNGSSHLNSVQSFNPATGIWTNLTGIPIIDHVHGLTPGQGNLYLIGGLNSNGQVYAANYRYNVAANTWTTTLASLPTARYNASVEYYNGKIYVFGGYAAFPAQNMVAATQVYDIATDTWETKASIPTLRGAASSAVVNGKIYVMGGYNGSVWLTKNEVYDPATDTWATAASLPTARASAGVAVDGDRVYLLGGGTGAGTLGSIIQYDVTANSWITLANPLLTPRRSGACGMINGKIYFTQGYSGSIEASTEVITPPKTVYLAEKQ